MLMTGRYAWTKKLWLGIGFVALMAMNVVAPAHAETASEKALRTKSLVVGYANQRPWGFTGPDGQATGFSPDMVKAAFEPLGITNITSVIAEVGALIPALAARRIDMVASALGINPERCRQAIFSEPDLAVGDGVLVAKGNPLKIHSYADIQANPKIRLGGGRGSSNAQNARDSGIPASQITLFQDHPSGVSALLGDRIDAYTLSMGSLVAIMSGGNVQNIERASPFKGLIKPNGEEFLNYAALAFRPADTDLRDLYNKRLIEMRKDGTLAKILVKYGFSATDNMPSENVKTAQLCSGQN